MEIEFLDFEILLIFDFFFEGLKLLFHELDLVLQFKDSHIIFLFIKTYLLLLVRLALELGHFVLQKLGLHFEFAGSFFPLFELRLQIFLVRFQIRGLTVGLLFIGNLEVELDVVHVATF